ncbi:hypothetical protein [Pseudovibrio exalbescens]|uniref:hypothetical protein n=1 Tax=Pseudovibrio exalbescens TaxID=197461 RepID=UPI00116120FB|nr:hypothetical protein [Pseudovibrio exalbescens]
MTSSIAPNHRMSSRTSAAQIRDPALEERAATSMSQSFATDVMPGWIRHPEQYGTEDAAAALLDPGSGAWVTEECVVRLFTLIHLG